jgi:ABC-2 type transport system ATP-binding protein
VLADAPVADIVGGTTGTTVRVCSPQATRLAELLAGPGISIASTTPQWLEVTGSTAQAIGEAAAAAQVVLHELTPVTGSLEAAYMALTQDSVEYHSTTSGLHPDHDGTGAPPPELFGADVPRSDTEGAIR